MPRNQPISGGQTRTISARVDGGAAVLLSVSSAAAVNFTLTDPAGRSITPSVAASDPAIDYGAAADVDYSSGQLQQYQITNPVAGSWTLRVQASTATTFGAWGVVSSPVDLVATTTSAQYRPGDTIMLEAALTNNNAPIAGSVITGTARYDQVAPTQLAFYDDGTHGDVTANNGIRTAHTPRPACVLLSPWRSLARKGCARASPTA